MRSPPGAAAPPTATPPVTSATSRASSSASTAAACSTADRGGSACSAITSPPTSPSTRAAAMPISSGPAPASMPGLELGGLRIRAGGTYSSLDLSGRRVADLHRLHRVAGRRDGRRGDPGLCRDRLPLPGRQRDLARALSPGGVRQCRVRRLQRRAAAPRGCASRPRTTISPPWPSAFAAAPWFRSAATPICASTVASAARHLSGDRMIFSLISLEASPNQSFDIRSAALDRFAVTGTLDATFELSRGDQPDGRLFGRDRSATRATMPRGRRWGSASDV